IRHVYDKQMTYSVGDRLRNSGETGFIDEQESLSVGDRRRWDVAVDDDIRFGVVFRRGHALEEHGRIDRVSDLHAVLKRQFGNGIYDLHAVLKLVQGYTALRVIRRLVVPSLTGQQPAAPSLRFSLPPPPA